MTFLYRIAVPVLGTAAALLSVPFAAMSAEQDHSDHQMDHLEHSPDSSGHGGGHSGHDTGSGSHIHHKHGVGGWMFEYKYMSMTMDGLLDGEDTISAADVTGTMMMPGPYMMAPTKMTMDMHMVMAMYAFNKKVSLMTMVNYLSKDMDMINRMGVESSMDTSGTGDTHLGLMYSINKQFITSVNVSIPTGSIDERGPMGANPDAKMPYNMQLGTGTYDLMPSMTYQMSKGGWSWGGQGALTYRIGESDNDYTLGNRFEATAWMKRKVGGNISLSGRLNFNKWAKIDGADPELMRMMSPVNDPEAQGGRRLDVLVGINGMFAGGHMLGLEVGVPVRQDLNGPQMKVDNMLTFAYQYMLM
ncbi:MAG: hypothetical protein COB30_011920 [Ectothiorhodospiraceae bacterium]|nr:hypothetical protein [Ectothiorhodospiraceae bacterium]